MKEDRFLYILRLVLEWLLIGLPAAAMVGDIVEPGSANGFVWAAIALMSGVRCIQALHYNRILEESRDRWKDLAEEAVGILQEAHEKTCGGWQEVKLMRTI